MRMMTKGELVNNIIAAWDKISPEMIKKSFEICGQVPNINPDRILCMREGKSCHSALPWLKDLLQYPTDQLDLDILEPVTPGEIVDIVVEEDEEDDPLE